MKLLAIDTSTDACTVALAVGDEARCQETHTPRVHAKQLLGMIDALLSEAGVALAALNGIVIGIGPGSFTGVRIGCSAAQGLALAGDLPVLAVSSLATVAAKFVPHRFVMPIEERGLERIIVAQDARMGELYWGVFAPHEAEVLDVLVADRADPPAKVIERVSALEPASKPLVLAGSGLHAQPSLQRLLGEQDHHLRALPSARDALALGARELAAGRAMPPEHALPVYFRPPV